MAATDDLADAMDVEVSPKNKTSSVEHDIHQSLGAISNSVESLEMRADPDAQATVTDFLDFTEYLPSDMMRSLTLIGKLDQTYGEASLNVHNLTSTWGKLPSIPAEERPSAVQLRADISDGLSHAVSSRVYAHAEAVRMSENVNRHYNRAKTILAKLKEMLENYPAEEQKSPVATSKSPQIVRAPRVMRNGDGERMRRPRIPRITVPGEVLPPYDQFLAYSDDSDESSEEEDDESLGRTPARSTPAPRIKVVKTPKARPPKTPKAASSVRAPKSTANPPAAAVPAVVLQPPPENAVIGSPDAPWLQLTPWELARLRKRMKKNATWNPSDTMILRELKTLGRGIDAYKEAKKKAEDEGRVFDQVPPALAPDAETGNRQIPEGAISAAALASDDIQLSNRGMKLNEAKKLKRESLAKQAAEEAEESARQFREAARLLMSHEAPSSASVSNNGADQPKPANKPSHKAKPKANGSKRKRDSVPEAEAEKPEPVETPSARPTAKRTKTETPVPLPHLRANLGSQPLTETPIPPPVLTPGGTAVTPKMTTPAPASIAGQDPAVMVAAKPANTTAPVSSPTSPAGPPASVTGAGPANIGTKLTADLVVHAPVLSPKKSTTPILPPVREPVSRRETRADMAKKTQQHAETPAPTPQSQGPQTRSSSAAPSIKQSSSRAATPGTTPVPDGQRRPSSRGKATSQEPQPSLVTERPRRASTARNTPAPEQRQPSKRTRKPVPGIVSKTNSGGSSAVGKRKAPPKKKRAQKKEKGQPVEIELEEDDEGNPIDPNEPRYCDCNRVSFAEMIACDNEYCDKEWFHLEFWNVVNEVGKERSLAQWAADHLKEQGRPLRIAVDEAHWRFKNVTDAKEAEIQKSCPGSHPREKAILQRSLPLLRLGIQLIFVFDGEERPETKNGVKRHRQYEATTALLKDTLDHFLVPWHQAPGEAEAECVMLQQKGLVDAVWSEDGDSFMFGCTLLIKDLRDGKNQKFKEQCQVFDMRDIRRIGLFNKKSITLFAMLTGCDYALAGLIGCGQSLARQLIKNGGLVEGFWRIQTESDAAAWRGRLEEAIAGITSSSNLTFNKEASNIRRFPDLKALKHCREPVVSEAEALDRLPCLQGEWYGTHTANSLVASMPWIQAHYFSRMTTIWLVEQFIPMTVNQRLLRNDPGARDLVAKITQKRKDGPTTCVEFDPCQVFPGIEDAIIVTEGIHLLNRRGQRDMDRGGQVIKNTKFDILDAILCRGLSETEFQRWRKEPKTPPPNKLHPVHPPAASQLQQTFHSSKASFTNSPFSAALYGIADYSMSFEPTPGSDTTSGPQYLMKEQQKMHDDIQSNKKQTLVKNARGTDLQELSAESVVYLWAGQVVRSNPTTKQIGSPTGPDDLQRKRPPKLDAGRSTVHTANDTKTRLLSLGLDKTYSLDDDDDDDDDERRETPHDGSKKRKLQDPRAAQPRQQVPGTQGRQVLREMELDSSQDSVWSVSIRTKGGGRSKPAAEEPIPGDAAEPHADGRGKGTADDPFEIL
ncbi:PHD-finger domain-containing protein [Colletotrichum higginsianum IMI 349063]|uniref:PHD-finger domain-containing protein n=2 Tax=Colletotrichum higginsianum (strain IMI 349063) TaxID=759273 RepID=A0A1B7YQ82_COLHI|nr:PHD-finger domain-containing protein [Colletotrichum higginsianum IMI 349063]OBR14173.1 PHD-finger domain-containing protein [Colletotrichum higginsianum IMI 349063]